MTCAANSLNSLARLAGSSLSSALGGTILAASTVTVGGLVLPSLTAYRVLFAVCGAAAILGAAIALVIPSHARQGEDREAPDGRVSHFTGQLFRLH